MSPHLFVYGTLRRDTRHDMYRVLARDADFVGDATINGRLYDLGEYPGAVRTADETSRIKGEVYRLRDPNTTLPVLDDYEGCGPNDTPPFEFERELVTASLEMGEELRTWVYWYRGKLDKKRRIVDGDFLRYASQQ